MALQVGDTVRRWSGLEGVVTALGDRGMVFVRFETPDGINEGWTHPSDLDDQSVFMPVRHADGRRVCYRAGEDLYDPDERGYFVAMISENTAGYTRMPGVPHTAEHARDLAQYWNNCAGWTEEDVLAIVASSMRQGSGNASHQD
jgi:hypothetical protein